MSLLKKPSTTKLSFTFLIISYLLIIIGIELISDNEVRSYILSIIAVIIGAFIAWYVGGLKVAQYTSIFGLITIALFTRQLWLAGVITSPQLFLAKSFVLIYLMVLSMTYLFYRIKSPTDVKIIRDQKLLAEEKQHISNLEYTIANKKLTNDLLSEANLVKDELHIMEGNWKSALHDITNDISSIEEKNIYEKIIRPYSDNIIKHLRELEQRLSYEIIDQSIDELYAFIRGKILNNSKLQNTPIEFLVEGGEWEKSKNQISLDKNKLWDIVHNIINNSMTAIDLKRISRIRSKDTSSFSPAVSIHFEIQNNQPIIKIEDNGGGVEKDKLQKLYHEPILSQKRNNQSVGQGAMLIKFFSEKMSIKLTASNIQNSQGKGLQTILTIHPHKPVST
jgi:signal transduction histidine kinase